MIQPTTTRWHLIIVQTLFINLIARYLGQAFTTYSARHGDTQWRSLRPHLVRIKAHTQRINPVVSAVTELGRGRGRMRKGTQVGTDRVQEIRGVFPRRGVSGMSPSRTEANRKEKAERPGCSWENSNATCKTREPGAGRCPEGSQTRTGLRAVYMSSWTKWNSGKKDRMNTNAHSRKNQENGPCISVEKAVTLTNAFRILIIP